MRLDSFDADAAVRGRVGEKLENGTLFASIHGDPIPWPRPKVRRLAGQRQRSVPDAGAQALRRHRRRRSAAEKSPVLRRSPHRPLREPARCPETTQFLRQPVDSPVPCGGWSWNAIAATRQRGFPAHSLPDRLFAVGAQGARYALEFSRQANGRVTVMHVLEYATAREPADPEIGAIRSQVECALAGAFTNYSRMNRRPGVTSTRSSPAARAAHRPRFCGGPLERRSTSSSCAATVDGTCVNTHDVVDREMPRAYRRA